MSTPYRTPGGASTGTVRPSAEGVETAEQLTHLRAAECDAAQGYLLSRPMPEANALDYLAAEPASAAV